MKKIKKPRDLYLTKTMNPTARVEEGDHGLRVVIEYCNLYQSKSRSTLIKWLEKAGEYISQQNRMKK